MRVLHVESTDGEANISFIVRNEFFVNKKREIDTLQNGKKIIKKV